MRLLLLLNNLMDILLLKWSRERSRKKCQLNFWLLFTIYM